MGESEVTLPLRHVIPDVVAKISQKESGHF